MAEPLRLEYACTPEELQQAQELHSGRALRTNPKWVLPTALVMGGLLIIAMLVIGPKGKIGLQYPLALFLLMVILTMLVWWERRRRDKEKKQAQDETITTLLEITPREVRLAGDTGWAIMSWSAFRKLLESETLFVLPTANGASLLVFPKRIFADEQARNSFRQMAERAGQSLETAPVEIAKPPSAAEPKPESLQIEINLQFVDYVDRALASWRLRIAMFVVAAVVLGLFVVASYNRAPNAPFSIGETFLYFCLPLLLALELVIFGFMTLGSWWRHRPFLSTQHLELSDTGMCCSQREVRASGEWNERIRYTETQQSFLLWWVDARDWIQIPKRSFATQNGIDRCRHILAKNVRRSKWFFG